MINWLAICLNTLLFSKLCEKKKISMHIRDGLHCARAAHYSKLMFSNKARILINVYQASAHDRISFQFWFVVSYEPVWAMTSNTDASYRSPIHPWSRNAMILHFCWEAKLGYSPHHPICLLQQQTDQQEERWNCQLLQKHPSQHSNGRVRHPQVCW